MSEGHFAPDELTREAALARDDRDPIRHMRADFHLPRRADGRDKVYFVGNSLGLQPKITADYVVEELDSWQKLAVDGHFQGAHPWMPYHEFLAEPMSRLVGSMPDEVVVMNSLTVNLHLMLATFYRPDDQRRKILIERGAFPSDHFAVESHIQHRGLDAHQNMLIVGEGDGDILDAEVIGSVIEQHANELALILLPGVQYYTGQCLDMERIAAAAHDHQIPIGFDLAHAVGNVPINLHDWGVDFAVWCTYKYLNCGPGAPGGCFVHQRHAADKSRNRLAGWWGQNKTTRFGMRNDFDPIGTAEGWQLSNPPILAMAAIRAGLEMFDRAGGILPLREKSLALTGYFAALLQHRLAEHVQIVTPADPTQRGCQLSLALRNATHGKRVHEALEEAGCVTDWREPNVIRAAPVPLYNSFIDVFEFVEELQRAVGME